MLKFGNLAPDFELPDQGGTPVRLSERLSHGSVLLYFYPADFTPVCTREACTFRELHPQLERQGAMVIGISPQDSESHMRFRAKYALPFTLLADPEKRVIRAYGCDGPFGLGVKRATFLIDRDARILDVAHAGLRVAPHAALARSLLDKAT
jgi:peroxiredoxin Q/BCP